jgi:ankyrin repeat protein
MKETPLMMAAWKGDTQTVKHLLQMGAAADTTTLVSTHMFLSHLSTLDELSNCRRDLLLSIWLQVEATSTS